jgi:hypothetical protein
MKVYKKIICSLILGLCIYSTQALIINEEVFKANGGDLNQIAASLKYANNSLRDKSFKDPFFTVGQISGCTATWLGDDSQSSSVATARIKVAFTNVVSGVGVQYPLLISASGGNLISKSTCSISTGAKDCSLDLSILKTAPAGAYSVDVEIKDSTPMPNTRIYRKSVKVTK